jgi:DnaK suppressor protein
MPNTTSSNRIPRIVSSKNQNTHRQGSARYADLRRELNRLRAILTHEVVASHLVATEPELFPDLTDQAAADHELDVALSVKIRTIEKLRRIEQALTSLHAHSYGICRRCGQEIPYARLKVLPDSIYCVPCQTVIECREQN